MSEVLTVRQAADALDVSRDTVLRAIDAGELAARRVQRKCPTAPQVITRFEMTVAAFEAYVNRYRTGPDSEWITMADLADRTRNRGRTLAEVADDEPTLGLYWLKVRVADGRLPATRARGRYQMSDQDVQKALDLAYAEQQERAERVRARRASSDVHQAAAA